MKRINRISNGKSRDIRNQKILKAVRNRQGNAQKNRKGHKKKRRAKKVQLDMKKSQKIRSEMQHGRINEKQIM